MIIIIFGRLLFIQSQSPSPPPSTTSSALPTMDDAGHVIDREKEFQMTLMVVYVLQNNTEKGTQG